MIWEAFTKNVQWWEKEARNIFSLCLLLRIRRRLTMSLVPQTNSVTESVSIVYEYLQLRICITFQELKSLFSWVRNNFLISDFSFSPTTQFNPEYLKWSKGQVGSIFYWIPVLGVVFFFFPWFLVFSLRQVPTFFKGNAPLSRSHLISLLSDIFSLFYVFFQEVTSLPWENTKLEAACKPTHTHKLRKKSILECLVSSL